MSLIEREAAIDAVERIGSVDTYADLEYAKDIFRNIPPAQPKQRTGKWTLGFDNRYMEKYYYCSCCGCRKYEEHEPLDCFCSNCGAKMIEK